MRPEARPETRAPTRQGASLRSAALLAGFSRHRHCISYRHAKRLRLREHGILVPIAR